MSRIANKPNEISLDPAVLAALPAGQVISVVKHGKTNWSTGYRVKVYVEQSVQEFFLKVLDRSRSDEMAKGEFESQKALTELIPDNVVPPLAWQRFHDAPEKAFYLTTFRYLHEQLPATSQLLPIVRKIHQSGSSPNGKFGFHVTTFWGPQPMDNSWTDSWEEYFTRKFRDALDYGQLPFGKDEDLCTLGNEFIEKVIPRLLRPLQTGGRTIEPTLCHGDLWDANVQVDANSGNPILFDPCCFYGHCEMDLQSMRAARNKLGREFVNAYKEQVGASKPEEDFDDRNALYCMRADLETVGMSPQWRTLLDHVKDEMRRLLSKHPNGIDGFYDRPR
ncbi:Fructosamine kinase-domain-containing protein [Xylariaceae sp. FL1019]|nr:Fructosamine kinase-domain-containing protein [Xylariaceae sp. FL1019]